MISLFCLLVALCLKVSATILHRQAEESCPFMLEAVGDASGGVVQDASGENRVGGAYPQLNYYFSNFALLDSLNHDCVITASSQFQCGVGSVGASNFSISDDGSLTHDDEQDWWACSAPDSGKEVSYNIFSHALKNTTGCETINLKPGTFKCTALSSSTTSTISLKASTSSLIISTTTRSTSTISTTSTTSTSTVATPPANNGQSVTSSVSTSSTLSAKASPTPQSTCPTDISSGVYQYPHLIVPTSSEHPNKSFGNSYTAYISPINTTLFNFDIPTSAAYKKNCALIFLFPFGAATYFSGDEEEKGENGGLDFALLSQIATSQTTYKSTSPVSIDYGKVQVLPGNNYTVATFQCPAGKTISYEVSSKGNVELDYFQKSGSNPIGLYIVPC